MDITGYDCRTVGPESCLRLYLLGPAWVEWQGELLAIPRRQARALLYCLAGKMQPVPREEICFGFWPDCPDASAHRYLSHLLTHLRRALPLSDIIVSRNDMVELDRRQVWSDAAVFRQACAAPADGATEALEKAVELYRGPFLSGFSLPERPEFEIWVAQQRSSFERMYLDALASLMRGAANQADWERATHYGRLYLRVDDLAEEVHRRLMVLYVMMGDRPAAVQQYKECEAVLKRELGVAPLPETRAIFQAVTHNEL